MLNEVRISKVIFWFYLVLANVLLIFAVKNALKSQFEWALFTLILAIFPLVFAFYTKSKVLKISNLDVTYKSWFISKAIKQVESIDVVGFSIFNKVEIVGRGGSKITLKYVANLKKVAELAEKLGSTQ